MDGLAVRITPAPQPMFNLTVDEAHTFFVGEQDWLVHNQDDCELIFKLTDNDLKESTEFFDRQKLDSIPPYSDEPCTVCAARMGLDPNLKGQTRAVAYMPEIGHAVLVVGDEISAMRVFDETPWGLMWASMDEINGVPLNQYVQNVGRTRGLNQLTMETHSIGATKKELANYLGILAE